MSASLVLRRRLAAELRALRLHARLSQDEVADHLDSSANKIIRIENSQSSVGASDLRQLLMLYGADADTRDRLLELGRDARKRGGWWSSYRDLLPGPYVQLEAEASLVRTYEPSLIPGLLQTLDYARAVAASGPGADAEEVERRVSVRAKRQERLQGEGALSLHALIDEAVLYRPAGTNAVRRAQLERLVEAAQTASIAVQIIPYDAGIYPGIGQPYAILSFPQAADPDVVLVEYRVGERYFDEAREVAMFAADFAAMRRVAKSERDSVRLIKSLIREISL
jgi:transcriptional regulator with XRE-family HTH domain